MLQGYYTASNVMNPTLTAAKTTLSKQVENFSKFLSSPADGITVATTAILGLVAAFKVLDKHFNLTYDTAFQNTSEHVESVKNTASEIEKLNSESKEYKSTLESMAQSYQINTDSIDSVSGLVDKIRSDAGTKLTLIDQAELDKIDRANASLETQQKLNCFTEVS